MKKVFLFNNIIAYLFSGFLTGLFFTLIYYSSLFKISGKSFSFNTFLNFHSQSFMSFFFDLLPFLTLLTGYLFFYAREKDKQNLRMLIDGESGKTRKAIDIAKELSEGKFRNLIIENPDQNELLNSLEQLKERLIENKDKESKRKNEDKQRNRISEGLAMFGDILREQSDNINKLAFELVKNLIRFLDANQGGFFITETDAKGRKYLNLLSSYAYDRKKFADKQIEWGEGILGTCAEEQKKIYMTDIPNNYLSITSGLGKSNPKNLLIVPLIHNNETKGIIEIASFQEFQKFEIDFVEKIAESVAMTIENIINSKRTTTLLEETRAQTEKLSIHEEKMRQSMEKLKATQEQAGLQAEKFVSFTNSVNHTMIRADFDLDGILLYANTKFLKKLGYGGNREIEGKHISMFINEKDREWFNVIWKSLSKGGAHFEGYMKHITKQGQDLWTMATYTCVRDENDEVEKVLFLAMDTTEQKKQSLDYEGQIKAIDRLSLKAEFTPDGKFLSSNSLFNNTLKYSKAESEIMNIYDFLDRKDIETLSETWEKVILGKTFQGQLRMLNKYKEEKWFRATFTSVNDMYDEVSKVIFIANEITNEKIMENETRKQTDQLKRQEEKFRIENLELNQKIKFFEKRTNKQVESLNKLLDSLNKLINLKKDISLVINNSGLVLFLSIQAEKIFDCTKKEILNKPAMSLLSRPGYPEQTEFIKKLFDPSKSKDFKNKTVQVNTKSGEIKDYKLIFSSFEINDEIIYLIHLT